MHLMSIAKHAYCGACLYMRSLWDTEHGAQAFNFQTFQEIFFMRGKYEWSRLVETEYA